MTESSLTPQRSPSRRASHTRSDRPPVVEPQDAAGTSLPDDEEIDLTLDIRLDRPRGSWLRLRGAFLNPTGRRRRVVEVRLNLNRALPLLERPVSSEVRFP